MKNDELEFQPLYDKVIVRRDAPEEKLSEEANIATPDQFKKRKNQGEVIAAGAGRICSDGTILPLTVKVGDRVLFGQHAGVDLEEADLVILREDELLGYQSNA